MTLQQVKQFLIDHAELMEQERILASRLSAWKKEVINATQGGLDGLGFGVNEKSIYRYLCERLAEKTVAQENLK